MRTGDEDIDKPASAGLPARHRHGVKDAGQGTHKVIGIGVRAEVAAVNGALDGSSKRRADERAGAFNKAHRAASYGLHGWNDEPFSSRAVDEEKPSRVGK